MRVPDSRRRLGARGTGPVERLTAGLTTRLARQDHQQQERWDEAIDQWRHVARLRALEPDGLLKLTEAQLHEKQWDDARKSIEQLNQTEWAPRFHNVRSQTEQLQRKLPR